MRIVKGMVGLMRSLPLAELQLQQQMQKMLQQQRRSSRKRSEMIPSSLAPPKTQILSDMQLEVEAAAIVQSPIKNWNYIHNIELNILTIHALMLSGIDI